LVKTAINKATEAGLERKPTVSKDPQRSLSGRVVHTA